MKVRSLGQIKLTKFSDSNYTLSTNTNDIVTVTKNDIDSDQDVIAFNIANEMATKNTASGTKIKYRAVGGDVMCKFMFLEDTSDAQNKQIRNYLYSLDSPDSKINSDSRREFFNKPGQDFSDWRNQCRLEFYPLSGVGVYDTTNVIIIPVGCVSVVESDKMFNTNPLDVTIMGVGGKRLVTIDSTANLSTNVDLSTGGTDKIVTITIDGVTQDVNFGQAAATTRAQIKTAIETAFSTANVADQGTNFLRLSSTIAGTDIVISNPTTGTSGLSLIFGFSETQIVDGVYPLIIK